MHVKIGKTYNLCSLEPWMPSLNDELTFTRVDHRHGYIPDDEPRTTFHQRRLYSVPDNTPTVGCFPAGLLARVLEFLRARGHTWEIADHRDLARVKPAPDFTNLDKLRPGQDKCILQIAYQDCGIIKAATAFGKSFIIKQCCKMYPNTRVLVTSPRVSVVNTLYRNLVEALGEDQVGIVGGGHDVRGRRVTVSTTKSMHKLNPTTIDLLFFDEVHGVGDNDVAKTLAYFNKCRMFGFTASPVRGDKSEMCMEALFGKFLVEFEYDEAVKLGNVVPIDVYMVKVGGTIREYKDTTRNKRVSYWQHERRNDVIRRVSAKVPAEEQCLIMVDTLEHAVRLHALMPEYTVVHFGKIRLEYHAHEWRRLDEQQARIAVTWRHTEPHAYKLITPEERAEDPTLPVYGWVGTRYTEKDFTENAKAAGRAVNYRKRLASYDELAELELEDLREGDYVLIRQDEYIQLPGGKRVAKSSLLLSSKEKEEIEKQFETAELKRVIATGTWKEGVDFQQLSVLIRADGATSFVNSTQIPGRLSRLSPETGKQRGILIDFRDEFNDWANSRTQKRLAVYRSHGWTIHN